MSAVEGSSSRVVKRKMADDPVEKSAKRSRTEHKPPDISSSIPRVPPLAAIYETLAPKYEVATTVITSSSSIQKKVGMILEHLGRFDWTNTSGRPGLVFLWSRSETCSKMVSIGEIAKRRMHEKDQKWYQYCRIQTDHSTALPPTRRLAQAPSRKNRGRPVRSRQRQNEDDSEEDDFEPMLTPFERAVMRQPVVNTVHYMSLFLSRMPIPELEQDGHYASRTNETLIDYERQRRPKHVA